MRVVTHILTAILAAIVVLIPVALRFPDVSEQYGILQILRAGAAVDKEIGDLNERLREQLTGLGAAIELERDFAMKLLVERDSLASEITDIAAQYMAPMGFSVLDITTREGTVLSSGHFPARAGGPARQKVEQLDFESLFFYESLRGQPVFTYQTKHAFSASGAQLFAIGGFAVDSAFLQNLRPHGGVRVLLRIGNDIIGRTGIETISDIMNNTIIINDSTYLATSVSLQTAGLDERAEIIVYSEQPRKMSLLDLF